MEETFLEKVYQPRPDNDDDDDDDEYDGIEAAYTRWLREQ